MCVCVRGTDPLYHPISITTLLTCFKIDVTNYSFYIECEHVCGENISKRRTFVI